MTDANGSTGDRLAGPPPTAPDIGLPARLNMRRAFDIYVSGRSRSLSPIEKGAVVGGHAETPFPQASREDSDGDSGLRASKVPIPSVLRFDRNAGTWRSLQDPSKGGAR